MMLRRTIALALSACTALALTACIPGVTTPEPIDTTQCLPQTAILSWDSPVEKPMKVVGVQVLTYSNGANDLAIETTQLPFAAKFSKGVLKELAALETATEDEWRDALLTSARDAKGIANEFGESIAVDDSSYVELTDPVDGAYVTTITAPVATLGFTLECVERAPVTGSITATTGGDLVAVPLECAGVAATPVENESIELATAREYCPA